MSKSSSSKTSKTDWPRLKAMQDKDMTAQLPSIRPLKMQHIVRGIVRQGSAARSPQDADFPAGGMPMCWRGSKRRGAGYQTRMNAVLRAFKEAAS